MALRRVARLAVVMGTVSFAATSGVVLAQHATAAPGGSLTSAVGSCSGKMPTGYNAVFVTGSFTGLTPNTSYQVELDQANPTQLGAKSFPPRTTNAAGGLTITSDPVYLPDPSTAYAPGPATFSVLPTDASSGALTLTGIVTITDGACVPTQLHATPSLLSLAPLHLYWLRLSARLTVNGAPIPGLTIIFRTKAAVLSDDAVTDANGVAHVNTLMPISRLRDLLAAGGRYTAVFLAPSGPRDVLESSSSTAPLIG
jgi:hypothetical protein